MVTLYLNAGSFIAEILNTEGTSSPTSPPSHPSVIINPGPPDIQPAPDATTPIPKPCNPSYTVKVWRHKWQDKVAAEYPKMGVRVVKTYSWMTKEGAYVREEMEISSSNFSNTDYNFVGWTVVRKYFK